MKIHLAFITRSLQPGGAERQLVTLINGLKPQLFKISLITFYPGGELLNQLNHPGLTVYSLDKANRWDILGFFVRYIRLIFRLKPDILHGYLAMSNVLVALAGLVYPRMKTVFGVRTSERNLNHYDWVAKVEYRSEAWLACLADYIIVNSEQGRKHLLKNHYPDQKIIVIQNGINTDVFIQDTSAGSTFRERWNIPLDSILIGLVARIDPVKNHPIFLQAASQITQHHPEVRLACIGSGNPDYSQQLLRMSERLGLSNSIFWIPSQSNIHEVYNALDVCCNVSESEGFSNVLAEAMSCGIPCIASGVGDSKLIVRDTGIIVPQGDAAALANAMQELIHQGKQGRIALGRLARQSIQDHYSTSLLVSRTEKVLIELASKKTK